MTGIQIGGLGVLFLSILLVARIPIGAAMFAAGASVYLLVNQGDTTGLLFTINNLAYARLSNYDLAVIPLFILMGQIATYGGLSGSLFKAAGTLIGHWKGGMAMAATAACAAFGAICGSSLATAATMGQVALPELKKQGYSGRLSTATLAASGTLGILIPPSVPLVIYAVLTQESIGKLFVAAVIPAIIAALGYVIVIRIIVTRDPKQGPSAPKVPFKEALKAQLGVIPVILVFLVVIVGIYDGWTNPTEAASIGVAACTLIALVQKQLNWHKIKLSIYGTAIACGMIFMILMGADLLNSAMALSQLPNELSIWAQQSGLHPLLILFAIIMIYILLGCVMDSLAMLLLTIPVFYPIIMGLDFFGLSQGDKSIWFGIIALMVVELGLITPPTGMNLFIINKMSKETPMIETIKGVIPFLVSDFIRIIVLVLFPSITLWLVHILK
ncbi:C4-dicarboxylate transport system large permease component [Gammaproteobacteria bacterium]|nr:C4-dicarboxylate transport system large permease component [Gammaproteobacteria bacterium]